MTCQHEEYYPQEGEALCLIFHIQATIPEMIRDTYGRKMKPGEAQRLYESDLKLKKKIDKILKL